MPNPDGNSDIAIYGIGTRFIEEYRSPNKPWSVRNAVRRLAAAEYDDTITTEQMKRVLLGRERTKLTGAQILAISRFLMALEGNEKFSQFVTDDIDGKLQNNTKMEGSLSVHDMTDAELDARIKELS